MLRRAVTPPIATFVLGDSPIVAAAVHDGHAVRAEIEPLFALNELERLREEDPYTGRWTEVAATRVVAGRSRFEFDLNRPRDQEIYRRPEDAWGLHVWKDALPDDAVAASLSAYDSFYAVLRTVLSGLVERHGNVVVLDLHTYNHRRAGPECAAADSAGFPEVNVGTGTLDHVKWGSLVDHFMRDLSAFDDLGRRLDVRENVCFQGGNLSRWIHEEFAGKVCSLAIEFKKFFMDEWTGVADERQVILIREALASTLPGLLRELRDADHA
ncbi:MAG: N-formylglutamate amidohydrolase [Planctomycetota bacterium]|nr:N-formylglutamate amidohydrolase [Planctomycetaceae bacterium]MDQ3329938.1 N-formylglutamate amidohydrolase [Planctomycetota bacterium]